MNTTLTLLAMPHEQAMRLLLQEALKPGVSVDSLLIGRTGFGSGTNAHVQIFIPEAAYQDSTWPYRGQVEFHYHRLPFSDFFQNIELTFNKVGTFPMSEIVDELCAIFNIVIEPTDYINTQITVDRLAQDVTLKANPVSPRWMGSVVIRIIDADHPDVPILVDDHGSYYIDQGTRIYITDEGPTP